MLQLQRLLRTADGLTTAASLGSFDDTEDDDLALAEPQAHERRALAADAEKDGRVGIRTGPEGHYRFR